MWSYKDHPQFNVASKASLHHTLAPITGVDNLLVFLSNLYFFAAFIAVMGFAGDLLLAIDNSY